ncbi:MAG: hypothetical protein IJW39_00455, partial [Opitutales bacterium]|nr:hypothetical protein [Opitutales bacterium]
MSFSAASFVSKSVLSALTLATAGTIALVASPIRYSGSDFLAGEPEKALNNVIAKTTGEPGQS